MTLEELYKLKWLFARLQMQASKEGAAILYRAYCHLVDQLPDKPLVH